MSASMRERLGTFLGLEERTFQRGRERVRKETVWD